MYAIGIGPDVVLSQLETIASRPEYGFRTEAASLPIVSSQLTDMIRQGKVLFLEVSVLSNILLSTYFDLYWVSPTLELIAE